MAIIVLRGALRTRRVAIDRSLVYARSTGNVTSENQRASERAHVRSHDAIMWLDAAALYLPATINPAIAQPRRCDQLPGRTTPAARECAASSEICGGPLITQDQDL